MHDAHEHDRGLSHDLPRLLSRRRAFGLLGGVGLVAAGCSTSDSGAASTSGAPEAPDGPPPGGAPDAEATTGATGDGIPEETAGPFPGDGSNGVNVLTESGVVRRDITTSFGSAAGVAAGVPLRVRLRVLDTAADSRPLAGAAVYVWQCDAAGRYSLYSDGATEENYLRGVQAADADGWLTFDSIYPAAYSGRWPHLHFEVYPDLAAATAVRDKLRTSQLALPEDVSAQVYATEGYAQSAANMAQTSLRTDMVFADGYSLQLAAVEGSVDDGFTATLRVPV